MKNWRSIADIRREYGQLQLADDAVSSDPFLQFKIWFAEVLNSEKSDPTAMVLSTVDEDGHPDSRVVLLKGLEDERYVFYTNYESRKAFQLEKSPYAALNFYWPQMIRQVRVRGKIEKISGAGSDEYFAKRPFESQLGAHAAIQSSMISSRESLEEAYEAVAARYLGQSVPRPDNWGGYAVIPHEIEFWQGRDNRLHDRICYVLQDGEWTHCRLAP